MSKKVTKPQYFRIALDIAKRITRGELEEGKKLYGRSVMATEYGVSPETIRRSFKLLSDVEIIAIKPQSCAVILSAKAAGEYIARFDESSNIHTLNLRLKEMIAQQAALNEEIVNTACDIVNIETKVMASSPFINYEINIPHGSEVTGKNIQELQFWQSTGATIIALRRGEEILLSPGPYAVLCENDILVFIGGDDSVQAVTSLVAGNI